MRTCLQTPFVKVITVSRRPCCLSLLDVFYCWRPWTTCLVRSGTNVCVVSYSSRCHWLTHSQSSLLCSSLRSSHSLRKGHLRAEWKAGAKHACIVGTTILIYCVYFPRNWCNSDLTIRRRKMVSVRSRCFYTILAFASPGLHCCTSRLLSLMLTPTILILAMRWCETLVFSVHPCRTRQRVRIRWRHYEDRHAASLRTTCNAWEEVPRFASCKTIWR